MFCWQSRKNCCTFWDIRSWVLPTALRIFSRTGKAHRKNQCVRNLLTTCRLDYLPPCPPSSRDHEPWRVFLATNVQGNHWLGFQRGYTPYPLLRAAQLQSPPSPT